jgi:hypothetical protein
LRHHPAGHCLLVKYLGQLLVKVLVQIALRRPGLWMYFV